MRAALFIRLRGDTVSNRELAEHLGVPARGLRGIMERSGMFVIEIRGNGARCQPWYRVRPEVIAPTRTEADMPALRSRIMPAAALPAIESK
jgi:hypothetical protein